MIVQSLLGESGTGVTPKGALIRTATLVGNTLKIERTGASTVSVDMSGLISGDDYLASATYVPATNTLNLTLNSGTIIPANLDASEFMKRTQAP